MNTKGSRLASLMVAFALIASVAGANVAANALPLEPLEQLGDGPCHWENTVLDGVSLEICIPFKPDTVALPTNEDLVQSASWVQFDSNEKFQLYVIPYGNYPAASDLPVSTQGISQKYQEAFDSFYSDREIGEFAAPSIQAFGEFVEGSTYVLPQKTTKTSGDLELSTEWIFEAGDRVWIVRHSMPRATDYTSQELQVIGRLRNVSLSSEDVKQPSISSELYQTYSAGSPSESTRSTEDLPAPSWWSGDCNVNNHPGSYPLGASYNGVKACGPLGVAWLVDFGVGVLQYEWQCPELSKRYLYLAYGIEPYSAHGRDVVWNYTGTRLEKVTNGTANKGPMPGDVLSYDGPTAEGHTSIVSSSNIDTSGNGWISIVEQNYSTSGSRTHAVSNWYVQSTDVVSGWLHDPGSGTDTTPPDGDYTSPANGATITTRTVHMAAWATDNSSGVRWVRFNAKWDGEWRTVHEDSSSPYEFEWDLCDFGVPDGDVELSLHIQDNAGNDFYLSDKHANPHITKDYDDCSSPPPTGDWNARYDQGSTLWWDPNAQITPRCTETITGPELHKDWGAAAPCGGMDGDDWVGDFQATLNFSPGNYVFLLDHDDGVKLWLNGQNIQERSGSGSGPVCPPRYLSGDHQLRLILREEGGDARIHLTWTNNTSVCMPDAPSLLSPADGSTFDEGQPITLSWSATGDEYYGELWGGPSGTTPFGWQTSTSRYYGSLWAGYTHYWHVKARNSVGESGWSSTRTLTVRPAAPSNLAAEAVSCGEVNLSWTDNSGSEEGYKIYRNGSYLAQVGANVTSYQDTGLTGSTTYSYYVKAYRGSIESAASNTADATTPACACPTITDWQGEYWSNPDLSGSRVLCRNDFSLDFDWAYESPDPAVPADGFSARWTRDWDFPAGTYRFHMLHDDGARLYIDDVLRLDKWGTCCAWATVDVVLTGGTHTIRVEMYENTGAAAADLWWERLDISGWRGEYYNNDALSDHPILVRDDKHIDFEWYGSSPDPLVQTDHFSARWTRTVWFASGTYQFDIFHDDGARLYVAGDLVFENWCDDCRQWESVTVPISEGPHSIRLEVFENSGWAAAKLSWEPLILPPAGPTALSATTVSESQIDLHWVDNADNEDGFRIERSLAETTGFTPIATVDADVNGYSDTGLSPDTTYYYRVYAFNTAGDSAYAAAHATTSSPPPAAPTALVATAVSESQIDLHWVDNAGNEAGFRIERSLYGTTGFSPIATLDADATAYSDIGLSPGTTYYYRVYAFNSTGDSAYVSASATTSSPPDPPLANFSGSPTSGEAPLPVSFTDLSLGDIDQWVWSFGDGGTSTARNPGHIYTVAGDYSVSLTVTGPAGSDTKTSTNYIHVSNPTVRVFLPLVMKRQVPPIPEDPVINGDFEDGPWVGWSEYSYQNYPIVMHEDLLYITPHSGSWIAWLGGARDETAYIEQAVVVPTGRSYLHFWQWRASAAPDCGADDALLLVNGRPVLNYDLCSLTNTGTWVETVVDLSTYAGQLVQLRFIAETVESVGSWYVDDVSFKVSADVADVSLSARPDLDLPITRAVKPAPGTPQP